MANAKRDENRVPTLIGVSSSDATTPLLLHVDPATNRLLVSAVITAGGSGGGTEYTEGDTDASITGGVVMWEDAADTIVTASAAKPLPVEIVAGAGSGGTAAADDADFTQGTTSGTPAMGVYESTPTTVTDGDMGIVGITADRRLKVLADLSATDNEVLDNIDADLTTIIGHVDGLETLIGTTNTTLGTIDTSLNDIEAALETAGGLVVNLGANNDVTVTGTVDLGATDNAVLDAIAASVAAIDTDATTIIGHVDGIEALLTTIDADTSVLSGLVLATQADDVANTSDGLQVTNFNMVYDGTTWDRLRGDSTNGALVNLGSNNDVTVTGTVDLGATDNAVLDAIAASVASIDTDATTIIGHVDGIEALLTTIDADTGSILTSVDGIEGLLITIDADTGSIMTAVQLLDDTIFTDDAAFTPGTSKVTVVGYQADETSTDSVDEGDAGAARMTLDRKQIVTPQPHTAGGLSIHRSIDLDEGTLEVVKNAPGQVYGMWVTNTATTTRFIKFYNATSGTYGTGTPVLTIPVPGNTSDDITGVFNVGGMGIEFSTGICVGAGTGVADADTGAPAANDVIVNIFYK